MCRTANCSGGKQQKEKREKRHEGREEARAAEKAARKDKHNSHYKKGSRNLKKKPNRIPIYVLPVGEENCHNFEAGEELRQ